MALGRVLALALLCHGVISGPAGVALSAQRKLHGRFLHITDIHPDAYYKVHSSTDEDGACHRGKGPAGPYGAETTDCDSPFSLVNATFDWIAANLRDTIDFVVWTGDSARHDGDERLPRDADQVLGTNTWIADKFADLFANAEGKGLTIPVVPTLGNNDILPHNILLPGPNKWLKHYSHIWRHFIPEEQRHSFEFGGWFDVEVIPDKLAVFSLNTLYFFDRNAGVDGCANPQEPGYKQMEWLRVQLQFLRERGMKAILIGHVPPARTESKKLWDETCWQKYSLWMHQFRDVVVAGLYGHMNIDHFLIHDKDEIDIAALSGSSELGARVAMEDELSVMSASDYLVELRNRWSKLTPPPGKRGEVAKDGKRKKGKKVKDPWGERYHLSLVSPSVVPNYFPTLRVLEYNITGLEDAPVWKGALTGVSRAVADEEASSQKHLELRDLSGETDVDDTTLTKKKKKKNKKPKKTPPHDPELHIPEPPSKSSPPGPAYSPQPLTLTGYTQYFANLTRINNLSLTDLSTSTSARPAVITFNEQDAGESGSEDRRGGWRDWLLRWRSGKHGGKKPASPHPPRPREFAFEVEYSTFDDRVYRLDDLTVNSFVDLADEEEEEDEDEDDDQESDVESDGDVETEKKKKKAKKGGKKGSKKRKLNKTWLHFLRHAFVGTLEEDELKKLY
ncbi:686f9d24-006c-44a6-957f-9e2d7f34a0ea [Thermothielavioides terrestris]|uniref:Endopolyphosphatase n=1 Tax=Thermothielavioides terrestris TaxID=2587410 RepID=A0A3S4EUI2_9PEZI|nr:686f9d24-006c-44a6-957f-9e2d7f34a0ea [Thermothielavioides terrestris]